MWKCLPREKEKPSNHQVKKIFRISNSSVTARTGKRDLFFFSLFFSGAFCWFYCWLLFPGPSTWCATERRVNALPWRRSTSKIWSWGTRSSRRLWRGTSSPSQRTRLWSLCSAPLKHGGTFAWSWNTWKVRPSDSPLTAKTPDQFTLIWNQLRMNTHNMHRRTDYCHSVMEHINHNCNVFKPISDFPLYLNDVML